MKNRHWPHATIVDVDIRTQVGTHLASLCTTAWYRSDHFFRIFTKYLISYVFLYGRFKGYVVHVTINLGETM